LHVDQHLIANTKRDLDRDARSALEFFCDLSSLHSREECPLATGDIPAHARIVLCCFLQDSISADTAGITSIVRIVLAILSQATIRRATTY
jgi:hypothetical protein